MELKDAHHLGERIRKWVLGKTKDDRILQAHLIFDDSTTRCGSCTMMFGADGKAIEHKGKWATIKLSSRFVLHNDEADVDDTLRHEFAHMVCNLRNGQIINRITKERERHGNAWKKVALELGAKPRSCADGVYVPKNFQLVCSNPKCKLFGKKQNETNKPPPPMSFYKCKCCKGKLDLQPNNCKQIEKAGLGQKILFD